MTSKGPRRRPLILGESAEHPTPSGGKQARPVARKRSRDGATEAPNVHSGALELPSERSEGVSRRPPATAAVSFDASTTSPAQPAAPEAAVELLSSDEYLKRIRRRHQEASRNPLTRKDTDHAAGAVVSVDALHNDPIYRIMHQAHRSDVVEIVKCKFGVEQCNTARRYFDAEFMKMPLRRLRLQLFCGMRARMELFLPLLAHHRHTLRLVDLSRNKLTSDDVSTLCDALELDRGSSPLEVLDLSYNVDIENRGAAHLFSRLSTNAYIRAVILRHVSIDDTGAAMIAPYLKARLVPAATPSGAAADSVQEQAGRVTPMCNFFVNLNQNCIGAPGIRSLRTDLPDHVSLTILHQHVQRVPQRQRDCSLTHEVDVE